MAANPSVTVTAVDGRISPSINTADQVGLKIGPAIGGRYNVPQLASTTLGVTTLYQSGPLVRSGAHHADYSGPLYLMRCRASTAGTTSSVTKVVSPTYPTSAGSLSLSLQSYTLHASAAAGAALNLTTGWTAPTAPLPLSITVGVGCAAHTQTVTYLDAAGDVQTETLTWSAAATKTTTGDVAQVLSVVSNVDPGGTSTYTATYSTPWDRSNALLTVTRGGQVGVSGATLPQYTLSYDGGVTTSRTYTLDSTGIVELFTYAGGLTAQPTGLKATFAAGTLTRTTYGGIRVAGATVNGDLVFDLKSSGVTVAITVSGPHPASINVGVVGSAITITPATDGGGSITSTGTSVKNAIEASGAASALVGVSTVGTGAGLVAAAVSAGAANGGVTYTALVEGVQVKHLRGSAGAARSVSATVSGTTRSLVITSATDSNGAQTSTANDVLEAIAANATAASWVSAVATGTGAGIVGCLNTYQTLPVSLATGDKFTWATTPPTFSTADLQESLNALLANETWLSYFSVLHIVGDVDATNAAVVSTFIDSAASQKKAYKPAVLEATYQGSTAEATWANALIAAFTTKTRNYGLAAGEANCVNSAYGTVDRVNAATPYFARLMICPISEQPSHVECDTILGTQTSLNGVLERPSTTSPLWQSDDALVTLNSSNFITLRKHPGRSGIYVRQGLQFTTDGSDYTFVSRARISAVARAIAYDQGLRFLNGSFEADPATGQIGEGAVQRLESQVGGALRRKLVGNDNGRTHASSVQFVVDRNTNFLSTNSIAANVYIVPKGIAETITIATQFSLTEV
jgi:hypothetical protein